MKPLVLALAAGICGLAWGYLSFHYEYFPFPIARHAVWEIQAYASGERLPESYSHFVRMRPSRRGDRSREELERLETLGYLGGVNAIDLAGVALHDPESAYPGPRLLSLGHQPEAQLIAPDGMILHRWSSAFENSLPDHAEAFEGNIAADNWRRVLLLDDGDLLAVHSMIGMVRLNRDSEVVWAKVNGAHHDVVPTGRGTFYHLAATLEPVGWFDSAKPIYHDYIVEIDADGKELWRMSLLEAIRDSPFAPLLNSLTGEDPLHPNSLQVLDGRHAKEIPAFRKGAVLTSLRHASAILVVDPEKRVVTWAQAGMTLFQHDPVLLESGNMLVFDNFGDSKRRGLRYWDEGLSRVLEFDPRTLEIVWSYDNSHGELFTNCCGKAQRLPNGNTLIVETNNGRVFEATPERRIVWDYYTPARKNEFIARMMDAAALEETPAWLRRPLEASAPD